MCRNLPVKLDTASIVRNISRPESIRECLLQIVGPFAYGKAQESRLAIKPGPSHNLAV